MQNILIYIFLAFISLGTLAAGDDGLYSAAPPPGSAFIRVVSAGTVPHDDVVIGGTTLGVARSGEAAPYQVVPGGEVRIDAGAASETAKFEAQRTYTVVLSDNSFTVIDDTMEPNLTKSTIMFYNLTSDNTVGLSTADGDTPVFGAIDTMTSAKIAVNPISIAFGVTRAGKVVSAGDSIKLERGAVYSIFATEADGLKIDFSQNSVQR